MTVDNESEWMLIIRCRKGSTTAFEPLVRAHEAQALALAEALLGDADDAADAVQDAFVKAYRSLKRLREGSAFGPWLTEHPRERLAAYLDGELSGDDASDVERHLRNCSECSRELAIMQHMGGAMRSLSSRRTQRSVWDGVHRRITRPVGWILFLIGLAIWAGLALVGWLRAELTLEWVAATAAAVGLFMLLLGIGYEQYRDWKETRYKDVER